MRQKTSAASSLISYSQYRVIYILDVVEAQWRSSARVLQRLGGEGFIMAVDEAADSEAVTYTQPEHLQSADIVQAVNWRI